MFDIGFIEMLVVGLILLLVVGPERLPEVARTVGGWVHQAKQYTESMKSELDRDLNFSELDRQTREVTETNRSTKSSGAGSDPQSGSTQDETEAAPASQTGPAEAPDGGGGGEAGTQGEDAVEAGKGGGSSPDLEDQAASELERELEESDKPNKDDQEDGDRRV